jgi:hypothetical protein
MLRKRGLLISLVLLPCIVSAQGDQLADDGATVRPVEAGSGGIIKPEHEYRSDAESRFDMHVHGLLESRYVTEGIDNLAGDAVISVSSETNVADLSFVPWLAYSDAADYAELNLNFVYGVQLKESLTAYLGYNHIRVHYRDEASHDNEINLDLYYHGLKHVQFFTTLYHSFQLDGTFLEAAVRNDTQVDSQTLFSLLFLLGANAGYVPDGHDGINHAQLRANIDYNPSARLEFYGYIAYNQAVNRDAVRYSGDELLGNFAWAGAGLAYRF